MAFHDHIARLASGLTKCAQNVIHDPSRGNITGFEVIITARSVAYIAWSTNTMVVNVQMVLADQVDGILSSESNHGTLVSHPPDAKMTWAEREDICRQLLHVLHGISEIHLEPNGHPLVGFGLPVQWHEGRVLMVPTVDLQSP
jgi:hypothetical protein